MTLNGCSFRVNLAKVLDIAIPVRFDDAQICAFDGPAAQRRDYESGSFIGNVARGGSCNCEIYSFSPHLNGTHTECVGHISETPVHIGDVLKDTMIPAHLITVTPAAHGSDLLIERQMLETALQGDRDFSGALIIRTNPNGPDKISRDYSTQMPPYFSAEAMNFIARRNFAHLLVDMPSVDRLDDGGRLENHRIFWGIALGQTHIDNPSPKTITELAYIPDEIADGLYFLNLQVAAFDGDAAPSHPVLYEVSPL